MIEKLNKIRLFVEGKRESLETLVKYDTPQDYNPSWDDQILLLNKVLEKIKEVDGE